MAGDKNPKRVKMRNKSGIEKEGEKKKRRKARDNLEKQIRLKTE